MGVRQPVCKISSGADRDLRRGRWERDERNDVDDAEPRVDADMMAEIEVMQRGGNQPTNRALGRRWVERREGEDRPVMIRVSMNVEQRR